MSDGQSKWFEPQTVVAIAALALTVGGLVWGASSMSGQLTNLSANFGIMAANYNELSKSIDRRFNDFGSRLSSIPNPDPRVAEIQSRLQENASHDHDQDARIDTLHDGFITLSSQMQQLQGAVGAKLVKDH